MSTPPPTEIVARIRRQIAAGRGDDEILDDLIAAGVSRPSAERFLASTRHPGRATAPEPARTPPRETMARVELGPPSPPPLDASSGRALFAAGLTGSVLVVSTWAVLHGHLAIRPRSLAFFGVSTLVAIARAWQAVRREDTLPHRAIAAAAGMPLLCAATLMTVSVVYPRLRAARDTADEERFAVAVRSAADRAAAERTRVADDAARAARVTGDQQRLLADLADQRRPDRQCAAAIALGRTNRPEHVPVLYEALQHTSAAVKPCAAAGLVALGDGLRMVGVYEEWARGNEPGLARAALSGFGAIGPAAAGAALPYLAKELESTQWTDRMAAVTVLARVGDAARPLLERAARDEHPDVRERAAEALGHLRAP